MSGPNYDKDLRTFTRTLAEAKATWLIWRRGKFSPDEVSAIKRGLDNWVHETCSKEGKARDEVLESLKWAKENKMKGWCDIATRCALPDRKVTAIRRCILRKMLPGSETDRWTKEQTAQFERAQAIHGPRAWKAIAQETGRTLEDVVNKGRMILQKVPSTGATRKFAREEALRIKLRELSESNDVSSASQCDNIKADCMLVAAIRDHIAPDGFFTSVYNVPWGKIAERFPLSQQELRFRWHICILPDIVKSVTNSLQDQLMMDCYLIWMARLACEGKLKDDNGLHVFPARDWYSLQFQYIIPLWASSTTESRLRQLLRGTRNFDTTPLPDAIHSAYKAMMAQWSKKEVCEAASRHIVEINRLLNTLADRGQQYFRQEL